MDFDIIKGGEGKSSVYFACRPFDKLRELPELVEGAVDRVDRVDRVDEVDSKRRMGFYPPNL
jgi:hypothetical protein